MSELYKQIGGKEVTVQEAIDEFLDEEADGLFAKLDSSQAKNLSSYNIRLVSTDIIPLHSPIEPMVMVAIAKMDDKHYGAIYRFITKKGAVEELHCNMTLTEIKGSRLIEDPTEWHIVSQFFIDNNVFEMSRIVQWTLAGQSTNVNDLTKTASKMLWLDKVNKDLAAKHKKILTPYDVAKKSMGNLPKENRANKTRPVRRPTK